MSKAAASIANYIKNCPGFESILKNIKIISAGNGACVAEYKVEPSATNIVGALHGGFSATLVDAVSSYALHSDQEKIIPSVSVDMHMTYMKAAKLGEEIIIDAKTMRGGKNLAYLKVEIRNKETGETLIQGLHTKYMLQEKK